MRKKRIKIIIGGFILALILGLGIFWGINKFYLKKEDEQVTQERLSIVNKKTFVDYTYLGNFNDYYIVSKNGHVGVIDSEENVKIDFTYSSTSAAIINKDSFIIVSDGKYYVYNKDLTLVDYPGDHDILYFFVDKKTNKTYYFNTYDDNLYDINKNVIFDKILDYVNIDAGDSVKVGNYMFIDHTIVNIENEKSFSINYYVSKDNYIYGINEAEKKLYYLDYNGDLETYQIEQFTTAGIILKSDAGDTYYLTINNGLVKKDSTVEVDDYKFIYNCSSGFKIYYQDNLVSDECYDEYYVNKGSNIINLIKGEFNYILNKDKIKKDSDESLVVGNYLTYYNNIDDSLTIKDLDDNELENICSSALTYRDSKTYICQDLYNSHLVDENLQPISDYYDSIECIDDNPYCIIKKDNKYGLLENNKVIIEPIYQMIKYNNDTKQFIASSIWGFDVYTLAKTLEETDKKLCEVEIPSPYESINTTDYINKYNLNYMEDLIKENEEFFKKYAYIVENNSNIDQYKDKVMNLFYEVIDNKDLLNEDIFLSSLKKLTIEKKDVLSQENANGLYHDFSKKIDLLVDTDDVIYHELTHFVDYSINDVNNNIYKCTDKNLNYQEFIKLDKEEQKSCKITYIDDINFLTEGGAEYYNSYYFHENAVVTYYLQTSIIGALSYIYGFDYIKDIYFDSTDGYAKLYDLFAKAKISDEDFNKFLDYSNRFHEYNEKDQVFITDTIIKLYESVKDTDWTKDYEFTEIITSILGSIQIDKSYTDNYDEYQKLDFDFMKKYKSIIPEIINDLNYYPARYFKTEDASYLVFRYYQNKDFAYEVVKYDFSNKTVLDKKTVILK